MFRKIEKSPGSRRRRRLVIRGDRMMPESMEELVGDPPESLLL